MKILTIITKSERGGAQIHVLDLLRMLREGATPILVCGDDGFLTMEARKLGVEVHIVPDLIHPIRPVQDARAVVAIVRLVNRIRPDVIHSHTAKAGLVGRLAGMLTRTPSFYTVHSWSFVGANSALLRTLAIWIERAMRVCGGTVIEVCHSNFQLARRMGVVNAKAHVAVWNGMPDTSHRAQHKARGPVRLFMAARFVEQKDHASLLQALAGIDVPWQLTLAGAGPLRPDMERLSSQLGLGDRVEFIGDIGGIDRLMAVSDILVLSTCYESLPLSIIEGMRAGLPVIATNVGGIPELVSDGVNGYLAPAGNPAGLREVLLRLIESPEERSRMGQHGRALYERSFRLEAMFGSVLSLYRDACNHQSPGVRMLLAPEVTR